ncbi:MAG: beta-galactosidase [Planctomycetota bacterium]|jgi:hypothetical protein
MDSREDSGAAVGEVRIHNGTPTVFIDGEPCFYFAAWPPAPEPGNEKTFREVISAIAARTGTHIYTFENGTGWVAPESCWIPGPGEGREGYFDFSSVEGQLRQFVDADPLARFHIRLFMEMNVEWWGDLYPEECVVNDQGRQYEQSYASVVWREMVKDFLRQFIAHVERIGYADRVVAYQVNTGSTCEWFKYSLNFADACGDYSEPMRRYFRTWLKDRYGNDVAALRKAWNDNEVTFQTAEVPSPADQMATKYHPWQEQADRGYVMGSQERARAQMMFRDPQKEQNVIDYLTANADLSADLVIDFCRTVKEASGGRAMAGVFYGYWMGFSLNSDYFRDYVDSTSEYGRLARTGHLGLQKVLESEHVDFFASPMEYAFRGPGGHSYAMIPLDAVRAHGKFYIQENDDRSWHPTFRDYGACKTVDEFLAVYRRTLVDAIIGGNGSWSVSLPAHVQRAEEIEGEAVTLGHASKVVDLPVEECELFVREAAACSRVGRFSLYTDRTPCAEIAVLIDDESFYYQTFRKNLELPLVTLQNVQHLPRIGAPVEIHTLNDFLEGRLRPFKMYMFLNAFRLDDERRAKLKTQLRRDNRVAVWMCAPGFINNDCDVEHMRGLTGFEFARMGPLWGPFAHIIDYDHPITRELPEGLFWGTDLNIAPVFRLQDADARILGNVVYSQGRCAEGFGVKEFGDWRSVYIAAPNVPAAVLRGIARWAGVHIYSDAGDVQYVSNELLAVHTLKGGARRFALPRKVEVVYDLFNQTRIASDADGFEVTLPAVSTSVFFTGDSKTLSRFKA